MKKLTFFIILFVCCLASAQTYITIPDANFENALIEQGIDSEGISDQQILQSDAEAVTSLNVYEKDIADLTGIEGFVNLTELDCSNNRLSNLDVSQNTLLERLICWGNRLTGLDVSSNTVLTDLYCAWNPIGSLDVSNNPSLNLLMCMNNELTELDVSNNHLLGYLDCSANRITDLTISENQVLYYLHCSSNRLTALDVTGCQALWKLRCSNNRLCKLDVSQNPALIELRCYNNQLGHLDVRNGNNEIFTTFNATVNNLLCINVDNETVGHSDWLVDPGVEYSNNCEALVINGTEDPYRVNSPVSISAELAYKNPLSVVWDWGDETSSEGSIDESTVAGEHSYVSAGLYEISLSVTDQCGDAITETYRHIVVYDPDGGLLAGFGRINSPDGAYLPDPLVEGPATFSMLSTYLQDGTTPVGTAGFQLRAGELFFRSTQLDWFVVNGSNAKLKGSGTANGSGNYGFMISAIDINQNWFQSQDLFRITIWDQTNGNIIYDNEYGQDLFSDPTSVISGGFIAIYNSNIRSGSESFNEYTFDNDVNRMPEMLVFPNPAKDYLKISIIGTENIPIQVNIYNVKGEQIYNALRMGDFSERIRILDYQPGLYIITCMINDKLIQQKVIIE